MLPRQSTKDVRVGDDGVKLLEMKEDLEDTEELDVLSPAKTKQIDALTKEVDDKIARVGLDGVKLSEMKTDLEDTEVSGMSDARCALVSTVRPKPKEVYAVIVKNKEVYADVWRLHHYNVILLIIIMITIIMIICCLDGSKGLMVSHVCFEGNFHQLLVRMAAKETPRLRMSSDGDLFCSVCLCCLFCTSRSYLAYLCVVMHSPCVADWHSWIELK